MSKWLNSHGIEEVQFGHFTGTFSSLRQCSLFSVLVCSMKVQQLQAALSREIPFLIPTTTTPYTKSKSPTPRDELESLITPPLLKAASGCLLAATAALI